MNKSYLPKFIIIVILIVILYQFININIKVLFYFSRNLGDNLNYYLLKDIIGGKVNFYSLNPKKSKPDESMDEINISILNKLAKTNLYFIGSSLQTICNWFYISKNKNLTAKSIISSLYFKIYNIFNPLIIFGTGFISNQNYYKESYVRNLKVVAVRGNETLQRLIKNDVKVPKNVLLADPGILAPFLINITNVSNLKFEKKYNLCVVPHYIDKKSKLLTNKIKVNNSIILDIQAGPNEFLLLLLKCKSVLSSGLHALIISDSLGIPNMRMVISDKIIGGDYKFRDYYSSYNISLPDKIDLRESYFTNIELEKIKLNYKISIDKIVQKQCELLRLFPYRMTMKYKLIKKNLCDKKRI